MNKMFYLRYRVMGKLDSTISNIYNFYMNRACFKLYLIKRRSAVVIFSTKKSTILPTCTSLPYTINMLQNNLHFLVTPLRRRDTHRVTFLFDLCMYVRHQIFLRYQMLHVVTSWSRGNALLQTGHMGEYFSIVAIQRYLTLLSFKASGVSFFIRFSSKLVTN